MSKKIDLTKIERIQSAALRCVSLSGSASVAEIAREAGVSVGYLYRHYTGKEELLNDILERSLSKISEKIESLLETQSSVESITRGFVEYVVAIAQSDPDKIRFILNLQNDLSYDIAPRITDRLKAICETILQRMNGSAMTAEDIYIALICTPLQYIGVEMRGVFASLSSESAERITERCLKCII